MKETVSRWWEDAKMHQQWDTGALFKTGTPGQGFCYHKCSLLSQLGKAAGSLGCWGILQDRLPSTPGHLGMKQGPHVLTAK